MMLSKLFPSWIAAKMMSAYQETLPSPSILSLSQATLLTISWTIDTLLSPLLPPRITVDHIFNTSNTCFELQAFDMHYSIIDNCCESKIQCDAAGCPNQKLQRQIQSRCRLNTLESGPITLVLDSAIVQQNPSEVGRIRVAWQHNT
jgi:hypothetical protein